MIQCWASDKILESNVTGLEKNVILMMIVREDYASLEPLRVYTCCFSVLVPMLFMQLDQSDNVSQ